MRNFTLFGVLLLSLLLVAGCATTDCCGTCSKDKDASACGSCSGEKCPETGKCGACPKAGAEGAGECACESLMAGGTGWCAACNKGFYEGKEVKCEGTCKANPGGPPCPNCVK